jgi:DNA-binding transcriptional LysR family regulator
MEHVPPAGRRPYKQLGLPQLRSFCEVCRLGSYAAAARAQLLTTPAVWEQMKALERHFAVQLLERDGNRIRPTLRGEHLLELVRPLLAGLASVQDVLQQREGLLPAQLTIVSPLRVLVHEISRAMSQFRIRYPTIRLVIRYVGPDVEPLVMERSTDVAFSLEPEPDRPLSSAIVYEPAGELDYLLVTPLHHALVRKRSFRLESIVEYPLVLGELDTYSRHRVHEVLHRHELISAMQVAGETSSDEYTVACVRAGLGVGIAVGNPRSLLYQGLGVRSLRRWFGTARVGFLWRRGAHLSPLQTELAELLCSSLRAGKQTPRLRR